VPFLQNRKRVSVVAASNHLDGCEVGVPAEGGEACRYVDLGRSATDYSVGRLAGTWFMIAATRRVPGLMVDDAVTSVLVDEQTANFTLRFIDRCITVPTEDNATVI